ncbi:prepilin-type N-terminal cleavage/methylation domain-containing protein [Candidatus Shapirobacteria bacterium]|nr:prepilin-type N-terminal cleavage/methylation domain-containing protein [Candidatus Shapirobacteria bacterium]
MVFIRKKISFLKQKGFTVIELMVALAIIAILILAALFAYKVQLAKGRDAKRKAELAKLQTALEDYLGDHLCYPPPDEFECNDDFSPYLSQIFCDPINDGHNIYYYSVADSGCKKWYKIFTTLEYKDDPVIETIGCLNHPEVCGPFNYVVSSPNAEIFTRQLGEIFPYEIFGSPDVTPSPGGGGVTPEVTSTPTPTPTTGGGQPGGPTSTPTPIPTPTPTTPCLSGNWFTCVGQGGKCNITVPGAPGAVCDEDCNSCNIVYGGEQTCDPDPTCL